MTALGYACKFGHASVARVLIEHGGKKNMGVGTERLTPMCWAAAMGNEELIETLFELKCNICGKDKYKRTPLILAIMNGHMRAASLLLRYGAEWNAGDSSLNTPLHYAAGYDWREAIDLLIKAGARVNDENMWKSTPINIDMLKNNFGAVKRLLEEDDIDVNGKDEEGRTLVALSCMKPNEESYDFIKFLIEEKRAVSSTDVNGFTPLHHLVSV